MHYYIYCFAIFTFPALLKAQCILYTPFELMLNINKVLSNTYSIEKYIFSDSSMLLLTNNDYISFYSYYKSQYTKSTNNVIKIDNAMVAEIPPEIFYRLKLLSVREGKLQLQHHYLTVAHNISHYLKYTLKYNHNITEYNIYAKKNKFNTAKLYGDSYYTYYQYYRYKHCENVKLQIYLNFLFSSAIMYDIFSLFLISVIVWFFLTVDSLKQFSKVIFVIIVLTMLYYNS